MSKICTIAKSWKMLESSLEIPCCTDIFPSNFTKCQTEAQSIMMFGTVFSCEFVQLILLINSRKTCVWLQKDTMYMSRDAIKRPFALELESTAQSCYRKLFMLCCLCFLCYRKLFMHLFVLKQHGKENSIIVLCYNVRRGRWAVLIQKIHYI